MQDARLALIVTAPSLAHAMSGGDELRAHAAVARQGLSAAGGGLARRGSRFSRRAEGRYAPLARQAASGRARIKIRSVCLPARSARP